MVQYITTGIATLTLYKKLSSLLVFNYKNQKGTKQLKFSYLFMLLLIKFDHFSMHCSSSFIWLRFSAL